MARKEWILRLAVAALAWALPGGAAVARADVNVNDSTIVGYMARDSQNQVQVFQPDALGERLKESSGNPENGRKATTGDTGYRIQVFADNSQRTAKSEAMSRKGQISARFPELECYLTYRAPVWRLRVGDFSTRGEATEMLEALKKSFPSYSREMIVVVDKINKSL